MPNENSTILTGNFPVGGNLLVFKGDWIKNLRHMIFLLNCTLIRTTIRLRRHFMPRQKGRDQIDKFSALVGNRLSVTIHYTGRIY